MCARHSGNILFYFILFIYLFYFILFLFYFIYLFIIFFFFLLTTLLVQKM